MNKIIIIIIIGYTIPLGTREKARPVNTGSQNHKPKLLNAEKIPDQW